MSHRLSAVLAHAAHRPWPLPSGRWVMAQTWQHLLFAHWPIAPELMRTLIPPALELDLFDGVAWIGVVPFLMSGVRPRWLPAMPWLSHFLELNVRTYVVTRDRGVEKHGVYFFSLDAANPVAVQIARTWFRLPYFNAAMTIVHQGAEVRYASRRTHHAATDAVLGSRYQPTSEVYNATPGAIDHWLTERYCLYTTDRQGHPFIGEIHHLPWPLQHAAAEFTANSMASAAGLSLPATAPLLHFARRLDVVVWPLRRVEGQ